ncbi:MAG: hypothetical protein DWQ01_16965 [Planctomycetota bacterium]|nr:MAG: hypothetical protein DWQ01_16965 [Planctomycetota bacterium]
MDSRPQFALALGGGAARGLAHIGILKVLQEARIPVAGVAGTSIGAVVGGLFAAGVLDSYEQLIRGFTTRSAYLFLDPVFPTSGVFAGRRLEALLEALVRGRRIESLAVPFIAVATDLETGEELRLQRGSLVAAQRASFAIPGLFTPQRWQGRWLVDGGLVAPVPIEAAQSFHLDGIIAVDLQYGCLHQPPPSTAQQSLEQRNEIAETETTQEIQSRIQAMSHDPSFSLQVRHFLQETWERGESAGHRLRERARRIWTQVGRKNEDRPPGLLETINTSMTLVQAKLFQAQVAQQKPDVILRPYLPDVGLMDYHKADYAIAEGERVAREALAAGAFEWKHRRQLRPQEDRTTAGS